MGIPKFYAWLYDKGYEDVFSSEPPTDVRSTMIDLNSDIHNSVGVDFGMAPGTSKEYLKKIQKAHYEDLEAAAILRTYETILQYRRETQVQTNLIIAVDGVAPLAKMNQQRYRRFKSGKTPRSKLIDTNCITPGTSFMRHLHEKFDIWLVRDQKILPPHVIYSSYLVPGEGEHKILDLMRNSSFGDGENGAHIMIGQDADLAMLMILSPLNNIYLRKKDTRTARDGTQREIANYISIDAFKRAIRKELKSETAIKDYVLMMFFLGNDFLPTVPSLDNMPVSIARMFDIYRKLDIPLTGESGIIFENLARFLEELSTLEVKMLEKLATTEWEYPSPLYDESIKKVQYTQTGGTDKKTKQYRFDFAKFRNLWYTNEFGDKEEHEMKILKTLTGLDFNVDKVGLMVTQYLTGVYWNYIYYTEGVAATNINYRYTYYHAPLLEDMVDYMLGRKDVTAITQEDLGRYRTDPEDVPFDIIHQLVSVLPPTSKKLLPKELQILTKSISPIFDLYPTDFLVEVYGRNDDYKYVVYIPGIDHDRIINVMDTLPLTDEFLDRYSPQNERILIDPERFEESIERQNRRESRPDRYNDQNRDRGNYRGRSRGRGDRGSRGGSRGGRGNRGDRGNYRGNRGSRGDRGNRGRDDRDDREPRENQERSERGRETGGNRPPRGQRGNIRARGGYYRPPPQEKINPSEAWKNVI